MDACCVGRRPTGSSDTGLGFAAQRGDSSRPSGSPITAPPKLSHQPSEQHAGFEALFIDHVESVEAAKEDGTAYDGPLLGSRDRIASGYSQSLALKRMMRVGQ